MGLIVSVADQASHRLLRQMFDRHLSDELGVILRILPSLNMLIVRDAIYIYIEWLATRGSAIKQDVNLFRLPWRDFVGLKIKLPLG